MEYSTIEIKVPKGYEKQIIDLVATKIEGILSQILLAPTDAQKSDYEDAILEVKNQKSIIK